MHVPEEGHSEQDAADSSISVSETGSGSGIKDLEEKAHTLMPEDLDLVIEESESVFDEYEMNPIHGENADMQVTMAMDNAIEPEPAPDQTKEDSGQNALEFEVGNTELLSYGEIFQEPTSKVSKVPPVDTVGPSGSPPQPETKPAVSRDSESKTLSSPLARNGVSRTSFLILASYASAVTLALIYLLMTGPQSSHELESLPDLEPIEIDEFQIIRMDAPVAPGHQMTLGSSAGRRFGNVIVRPLRVTRGPVEFEYFQATNRVKQRPPTPPVLKLWLEFENVSSNQVFAPLDLRLMTQDHVDSATFERFAHTFLRLAGSNSVETRVFTLGHSPDDPWNMTDQALGHRIGPGETCTVYIPSDTEQLDQMRGDMVWRVQFRKGFHAATKNGVTTLIDVAFSEDEIEEETPQTPSSI